MNCWVQEKWVICGNGRVLKEAGRNNFLVLEIKEQEDELGDRVTRNGEIGSQKGSSAEVDD